MFCFGKRRDRAVRVELVLHEDEIPELEEALAAGAAGRAVRLAATHRLAPVVEELRVGAARARAADRPEVFRGRQRRDPLRRDADLLPEADRLLVGAETELGIARVHARPDPVPVELQPLLDELGRVLDRAFLEVLAERPAAEHLEERQVGACRARPRRCRRCGRPSGRVATSGAGGSSLPRKYGISGCIPALMNSVVWSSARGISDAEGRRTWPFSSKKARKPSRSSAVVRIGRLLEAISSRIFSSARRISRETCICEMPTCWAIWDCVSPSKNRRWRIIRSRSSSTRKPRLEHGPLLGEPISGLLGADRLERVELILVVAPADTGRERDGAVRAAALERLEHLLLGAGRLG